MPYEEDKINPPSQYTQKKTWDNRTQYGNILLDLISSTVTMYNRERKKTMKIKMTKDIAYLIQVVNSLIKDEKGIDERLDALELMAGIAKKGVIKR